MKSLISKVGHSVMMRLALIIGAMGVMIGIAIYVSWTVFQSIENQMHTMSDERLPQLRASAGVTTAVDETRALLSEILIANPTDELAELRDKQSSTTSAFREALSALPANQLESASGLLNDTETALAALLDAREAEQKALADAALTLEDAFANATSISARLEEATDTALFDMTLSGEDAITSIDQTLSGLVERDFAQFQTVLAIQSEVNLLTGLGLSLERGFSAATQSIAEDLALSSIDRLRSHLDLAIAEESLSQVADKISVALETYERVFGSSLSSSNSQEILDLRVAIDSVLSPAVDDVNFNLIIGSEEAKETSKVALSGLLETEVAKMRNMASLDAATKSFFAFALKAAVARDPLELDLARVKLAEQETVVRSLMTGETEESIMSGVEKLLALSQQGVGIADKRSAVFASKIAAGKAAADASRAVSAIAIETAAFATNSVNSIQQTANSLGVRVATAGNQIAQIGWISFVFLLAAPIFVWALITRPLNRVTRVTERLANGDLSEIQGLRSNEGELGRLAKALYVFRENALQTIEMREEEKKREKAALEEEKANEQARRAEIEAQKKIQQEREEEAQAQTEAARQKMISDLSASLGFVVSAASEGDFSQRVDASFEDRELVGLANSVNSLVESVEAGLSETARVLSLVAAGDLTENMVGSFRGAFADLQNDTNGMIDALRDLIIDITNSGVTLSGSSAELRDTSNGLSHRAEQNAASLEETSAALEELTVSVKQVSKTVADANKNASLASNTAKSSGTVAAEAAEAMSRISDASSEITKVVSVINEIAFQINLLALNAGVEAARAGEAGRGFSVVASEVRQLAQRAANSVSEISDVIAQSDTAVSEGVAKVSNAKDSLEQISESVIGVSQSIDMISAAINEQVNGIGEINSAVAQIDNNTQKQAASFEEVTAASALLSNEADALRHSTARFKTAHECEAANCEPKKAV